MREGLVLRSDAFGSVGSPISPIRPVRLAIGALREEIERWSRSKLPVIPEAWVLQSLLTGLAWRFEHWADVKKEILAVALVAR